MSGSLDRIRRILGDHAPALAPASEIAPPAEGAPSRSQQVDALRARLRAMRVGLAPSPPRPDGARSDGVEGDDMPAGSEGSGRSRSASATPLVLPEDDDERSLEERVGAIRRPGPKGSYWEVVHRYALSGTHGSVVLSTAFERPLPLRPRERRAGGSVSVDPRSAVFLDIETTGLAGGTGTVAFLVGAASVEGDAVVLRQYFLPDFPDEAALLEALASDLGDRPLVTFNGRSFDAPMLATRFRLHRIPFPERDHLDLLPPSRRLWSTSLESHRLASLEQAVLGVAREADLPGALVPAAYFAWLREGRSRALSLAFRHNETDVISLVALAGVVSQTLADPTARRNAPAGDHLDTARLLLEHGERERARACLAAITVGLDSAAVRRLLGTLQRRSGDLDGALATWAAWVEAVRSAGSSGAAGRSFDPHPFEEIAKHREHKAKDPAAALALVEEALARCARDDRRREALEHRAGRLRGAIARRPGSRRPRA